MSNNKRNDLKECVRRELAEDRYLGRGTAGSILALVSEYCVCGAWSEHLTPYEFGAAVSRALETTFDGREVLGDFIAGYMDQVNAKGKPRSVSA